MIFKTLCLVLLFFFSAYANLTLDEKIGQLLLVHFNGTIANEDSKILLTKAHVGSFIYYTWANELTSFEQVKALSHSLQLQNEQGRGKIPLIIAVDQEGGRVARLTSGFTLFPSQKTRADQKLDEKKIAETIGVELEAAGITLNFAPVVDVTRKNSIINDRSYGENPILVADFGKAALEGYKNTNVIPVLKHFPGHGDVSVDSHEKTPRVDKSLDALTEMELFPFKELIPFTHAIMTAHILVPALDPITPATFSKPILEDLLRGKLGFGGVIISDSLVMKGATSHFASIEEAALQALIAGCDLLCLGGRLLNEASKDEFGPEDVIRIHKYLVVAVKEGKISTEAIDAKVQRILKLKDPFLKVKERLSPSKIGKAIWQNECKGGVDGLVSWNAAENFMSLGIGHFIWYPEGENPVFEAGFPLYLAFLKSKKITIPEEFANLKYAPWRTREEFLKEKQGALAQAFRKWLSETVDLQTSFIIERFFDSVSNILEAVDEQENKKLIALVQKIAATENGAFALIDYMNFKGNGLSPKERYNGKGWGLIQVLLAMQLETKAPLKDFQTAAIAALEERVKNSPAKRNEARFLEGWKNRILRYTLSGL